jgi:hypothetical protein
MSSVHNAYGYTQWVGQWVGCLNDEMQVLLDNCEV